MLLSLSFKLFWRHRQEQVVMILRIMPNSCSLQFKLTFLTVSRICSEIVLSEIEAQSTRSWIFLKPQIFWCGLEDFSRPSRSVFQLEFARPHASGFTLVSRTPQ